LPELPLPPALLAPGLLPPPVLLALDLFPPPVFLALDLLPLPLLGPDVLFPAFTGLPTVQKDRPDHPGARA